jgi:hypothetical protein
LGEMFGGVREWNHFDLDTWDAAMEDSPTEWQTFI